MGNLPDGVFDVFDDVIRVISAPSWTVERLTRLARSLAEARQQRASPEAVTQVVVDQAPELESTFRRLLIPTDAGQFYALLAVIIMIFSLSADRGGNVTAEDAQRITNEAVERCAGRPPTESPTVGHPSAREPLERKSPQAKSH